ncbi:hypothetical protein [Microbacterium sp. G2-8]|uniref:hypothetical protein n=1 Tax=Microbacterium sp. G2-8 TaxID=2842454 RepID=UPI001C891EBF|nr:hypothetical protein [Microbacterium sp. G2-8]
MTYRSRASRVIVATVVAAMTGGFLVGCAGDSKEAEPVKNEWPSLVGEPMSAVALKELANDNEGVLYVQDASVVLGKEASYMPIEFGNPKWTIVGACGNGKTWETSTAVELAVVPTPEDPSKILTMVDAGDFDRSITCDGRKYHS